MRVIEPLGRISSIPPTQRSFSSNGYVQGSGSDPFYGLLKDAMSARQESRGEFSARRSELYHWRLGKRLTLF